jgi:hypothetical protein
VCARARVCVRTCMRACARACVRACVRDEVNVWYEYMRLDGGGGVVRRGYRPLGRLLGLPNLL